jgi:hypothetical protein
MTNNALTSETNRNKLESDKKKKEGRTSLIILELSLILKEYT